MRLPLQSPQQGTKSNVTHRLPTGRVRDERAAGRQRPSCRTRERCAAQRRRRPARRPPPHRPGRRCMRAPIRRFARELGVELAPSRQRAQRPDHARRRAGVREERARAPAPPARGAAAPADGLGLPAPWPKVDFAQFGPVDACRSPHPEICGPVLARNWVLIPHVTQNDDADVTDSKRSAAVNGEQKDVKVTMLAFLIKAAVAALRGSRSSTARSTATSSFSSGTTTSASPPTRRTGSSFRSSATPTRRRPRHRARDGRSLQESARRQARTGRHVWRTFTIIARRDRRDVLHADHQRAGSRDPRRVQSRERPVWDGTAFEPRLMQPLSFSYDHRVVDGAPPRVSRS